MFSRNYFILFVVLVISVGGLIYYFQFNSAGNSLVLSNQAGDRPRILAQLGTNHEKTEIPFDKIVSGGPGKDGIPALLEPRFTSIELASSNIQDDTAGILVAVGNDYKFYPFNIMLWHEVVNDIVGGEKLLITFCPLCASAIVFERAVAGEELVFGVSGLLYESNLLMYDKATESLWSQVLGRAVVGDYVGTKLQHFPFQLLDFKVIKDRYPEARVLSEETGYYRDYSINPYRRYETSAELYFPVSFTDMRLPAKTLMYIVDLNGVSVALRAEDLSQAPMVIEAGKEKLVVSESQGEVEVRYQNTGELIPGYYATWFSWAVHHQDNGIVWTK